MRRPVLICGILFLTVFLYSRSLWRDRDLFSTRKNVRIGDILKVRFATDNLIRYRNSMKTGVSREVNRRKPAIKTFSFLPAFDFSFTRKDDNSVEYSTEKEFRARIAVQVTAVNTNTRNITFQGQHTIIINGQAENITIIGLVRQDDLRDDNTILSRDIANLRFSYQGPTSERRTLLNRGDLVYPSANTNTGATNSGMTNRAGQLPSISRAARQRLILDFLNRVAASLFRR